jgi:hypothetical protein
MFAESSGESFADADLTPKDGFTWYEGYRARGGQEEPVADQALDIEMLKEVARGIL